MGNDKYAHLGWGFALIGDDEEPLQIPKLGTEDFITAAYGLVEPKVPYESDADKAVHAAHWELKRDTVKKSGIGFLWHDVSREQTVYILVVAESSHQAGSSNNPTALPTVLETKEEWREIIRSFCELSGIPFREPHWVLSQSWDK